MSETGISLINFIPRAEVETGKIRRVQELRHMTKGTWTQANKWKAYRAPRYLPGTYEQTLMLYTTHIVFLEMLFSKDNGHLGGAKPCETAANEHGKISDWLAPMYFANVT